MVLARVEGGPPGLKGVSLFLLPRRLGGAQAHLVGELGRGFVHMADMVTLESQRHAIGIVYAWFSWMLAVGYLATRRSPRLSRAWSRVLHAS